MAFYTHLDHKTLNEITKDDILAYLNSRVKKPATLDPIHKWIGTYNGTQMVFSSFFRWLYNPDEPDTGKRITPPCMRGIKRLPRQEKSPSKPSDLWPLIFTRRNKRSKYLYRDQLLISICLLHNKCLTL